MAAGVCGRLLRSMEADSDMTQELRMVTWAVNPADRPETLILRLVVAVVAEALSLRSSLLP